MSYYHAAFTAIFIAGMAVIAYVVIRAWRHGARELDGLLRLGEADDYPVARPCPWCPVTPEDGATDDATRHDCNCAGDCGEPWCGRKTYTQTWSGS